MTGNIISFIAYLGVLLTIGILASYYRPIKKLDDFILGNRSFGSVVTGLAVGSTLGSGYVFIGLVGTGYAAGFMALWLAVLCPIFDFIAWYFLGPKMHKYSLENNAMTPVDILAKLKGDPHNLIRIIGGTSIAVFMFVYLGSNFIAAAKAATVINMDYNTAALVSAIVVIIYTMLGGVTAVMWTDALQGALMIIGVIFLPVFAIIKVGGLGNLIDAVYAAQPMLVSWTGLKSGIPLFIGLWMWISVGVGYLGQPQGLQKFITISSPRELPGAALISTFMNFARQYFPVLLGLAGRVLYEGIKDPEYITPFFIRDMFPQVIGGILLAAIFAAIMSTTDSLLMQGTSEFVRNVIQSVLYKNRSEKFYARVSQVVTLIIGVAALILALYGPKNVFYLALFAWAGLAASIGPAMFAGLFWQKTTSWGILAGIISGSVSAYIWYNGGKKLLGLHEGLASFLIASFAVIIVSILTSSSLKKIQGSKQVISK